jgi:hypothetical protein
MSYHLVANVLAQAKVRTGVVERNQLGTGSKEPYRHG